MKRKILILLFILAGISQTTNAQIVLSEDFEGTTGTALPSGWTQVNSGTDTWSGWLTGTSATIFATTSFSITDHTRFIAVNDAAEPSPNNTNAFLKTPAFDLSGLSGLPYLSFDEFYWHYSSFSDVESLDVVISTDGGVNWTTISTEDNSHGWATRKISLVPYSGMSNVMLGFRYSDAGATIIGADLDNIQVLVSPNTDIQMLEAPQIYGALGSNVNISGVVKNNSVSAVSSYVIKYQEGSGPVYSYTVSTPIPMLDTAHFTHSIPYAVGSLGNHNLKVWAEQSGDEVHANDTLALSIIGVPFMPQKRIAIEEATGTWCGYCVRGIAYLDSMRLIHPDNFSLIAVHDDDPMTVSAYDNFIAWMPGFMGYPTLVVDRRELLDPEDLFDIYNEEHNYFGYASIDLGTATLSGSTYTLPVTVTPAIDMTGGYRLALVLTEDDVHSTSASYDQHNYYSGGSYGPLASTEYNFVTLGATINDLYFDFVARSISNPTGDAGTLPASMTAGTAYTYTYTVPVDPSWHSNNMHAVVMLLRTSDGTVLNSNSTGSALNALPVSSNIRGVRTYPNPASSEIHLEAELGKTEDLSIVLTNVTGQVVYTHNSSAASAGENYFTIQTGGFADGVYTLTIKTPSASSTQKVCVMNH